MLSFWEQQSFTHYDAIIIGGGIIGLSTAISLAEQEPTVSIVVLERGLFSSGASTKNAGFACFGSLTEVAADMALLGEQAAVDIVDKRRRGLELLRQRLGDEAMSYEQHGGYELLFDTDIPPLANLDRINHLLRPMFGGDAFVLRNDLIKPFGFDTTSVRGLVSNPFEGQIHTGKMMRSLARLATERGVEILTGAQVVDIAEAHNGVEVAVRHEQINERVVFRAQQVAVCTNAVTQRLLPDIHVEPGRGQVLVTHPIDGLPWKGVFHFDEGFYYFRDIGGRVLFGGGRNMAFDEENTDEFEYNERIFERLDELLRTVILPGREFTIDQRWTGIMGFSEDKSPIVKRVSDYVVVGFGCNGMGVAIGSLIGEETAAEVRRVKLEG